MSAVKTRERKINSLFSLLLSGLINTIIHLSLDQGREKTLRMCMLQGRGGGDGHGRGGRQRKGPLGSVSRWEPAWVRQVSSEGAGKW